MPGAEAILEGFGPDGTAYRLELGPYSVPRPMTVELRRLTGSAVDGTLMAGVDIEPNGTELVEPALLVISPVAQPAEVLAAVEYRGDPASTVSAIIPGEFDGESLSLIATHFSGFAAVDVPASTLTTMQSALAADSPSGSSGTSQQAEGLAALTAYLLQSNDSTASDDLAAFDQQPHRGHPTHR